MLLSLSTACLFPRSWPTIFRLAAECGMDGIELVVDHQLWLGGAARARSLAAEHGLEILSIHQTYMPLSPSGGGTDVIIDAAKAALALDVPRVVIHGPFCNAWRERTAQSWLRSFDRVQTLLAGSGIRVGLENVGVYTDWDEQNVLAQTSVLDSFARRHEIGITLDVCHLSLNESPLAAYELMKDLLVNIHFSDQQGVREEKNRFGRALSTHHRMPGEGQLSLKPFVSRLLADGYDGPLTFEVSPSSLNVWSLERARARLDQAVAWIRACQEDASA